jgi:hypothetical protein
MVGGMDTAPQPSALLPFCLRLEDGANNARARVKSGVVHGYGREHR